VLSDGPAGAVVATAVSAGHVTVTAHRLSGSLTKIGALVKSWQQREFVLDLGLRTLAYYTDATLRKRKGEVPLAAILVAAEAPPSAGQAFPMIVATQGRTYAVQCPSAAARTAWLAALAAIAGRDLPL
jgi:hypothetical protein